MVELKEEESIICPLKIKDLNSYEYLIYFSNNQVIIRNLPSLSIQIIFKNISNVKNLCIKDDLTTIFCINEDGTQIQAIKN